MNKPKTPLQSVEAYLKREEVNLPASPRLQPRTSALIGKVQELLPGLVRKQNGPESRFSDEGAQLEAPAMAQAARLFTESTSRQHAEEEKRTSELMKGLHLDDGHMNSEILKELETAKACLDRASALLMVQKKAGASELPGSSNVKTLLNEASKLVHEADIMARGEHSTSKRY